MKNALIVFVFLNFFSALYADTLVWKGELASNGTPSPAITLVMGKKYEVRIHGSMNLGKWWQQGKPLSEDACFEYDGNIEPTKCDVFRTSMANVHLIDDTYNANHQYRSKPFVATQDRIHFWIHDTDYSNNVGGLFVEVVEI